MAERLFVYGTLRPEAAPAEVEDLVTQFVSIGRASMRGTVFELHGFPGLVLDPVADPVPGELFEVPAGAWDRLDLHEGYDPEVKESSLFHRVEAVCETSAGTLERCFVYVYNRHE